MPWASSIKDVAELTAAIKLFATKRSEVMACRIISATVLLLAVIPSSYSSSWWSVVTKTNEVLDPLDVTSPIDQNCVNPNLFEGILSLNQIRLCQRDAKLLSSVAIGILRALNECQKLFRNRPWNCSVFDFGPYLGRFIEQGTPETAFLDAIICAGIAREVAKQCKAQNLDSCSCDYSIPSSNMNGEIVISGCGDNCAYGNQIAEQFTTTDDDSCIGLATLQNNKVGRLVVTKTNTKCVCHGVSGSCTVKTCFKSVADIEEIGKKLLSKYDVAKRVEKGDGGKLKPAEPSAPPVAPSELTYCKFSPNFCQRNLTYGIYGSSGRQCWQNGNVPSSCAVLCCGGPVVQRQVRKEETVCEFVWCCEVKCRVVRVYNETEYYCK